MAITNQERVGKAMELLRAGLAPFVEREIKNARRASHGSRDPASRRPHAGDKKPIAEWDAPACSS
jgi:hypothetical protein